MVIWTFILFVFLLMAAILFLNKKRQKPFNGIKKFLPQGNYETGEELMPLYQDKAYNLKEKLGTPEEPFFDVTLDLYLLERKVLRAEWSISKRFKKSLTEKYGKEFWHNCQGVFRLIHSNAVPQPYYQDTKVDLDDGQLEIKIDLPGEILSSEIGVVTETGAFISLARSNDVTVPENDVEKKVWKFN